MDLRLSQTDYKRILVEALSKLLREDASETAERALRRALREAGPGIGNIERKTIARWLFGTSSLRARISFVLDSLSGPIDARDTVIAFVTVYVLMEQDKYFTDPLLAKEWLVYAADTIPDTLTAIQRACANPPTATIPWPSIHDPIQHVAICYSYPTWLASLMVQSCSNPEEDNSQVQAAAFKLANAFNHPGPPTFRGNLAKCISRENLIESLRTVNIHCIPSRFSNAGVHVPGDVKPEIRNNPFNKDGSFDVQDEGSQLISIATGARAGMRVVDLCCGRGGKALHLLDMMKTTPSAMGDGSDGGILVCHDVDAATLRQAKQRLDKFLPHNIQVITVFSSHSEPQASLSLTGGRGGDVSFPSASASTEPKPHSTSPIQIDDASINYIPIDIQQVLAAMGGHMADIVLVDAPCSSLGTLRRGPNVRWEMAPESLCIFPPLQKAILASATRLVQLSGTLVYATCTFNKAECGDIQAWFDQTYGHAFKPAPLVDVLGEAVMRGLVGDGGGDDWQTRSMKDSSNPSNATSMSVSLLWAFPVVTFGLGCWQVQRLQWKVNLIEDAKSRLNAPAVPIADFIAEGGLRAPSAETQFKKVRLVGNFVPGLDMYVGPRTRGAAGELDSGGGLGGGRPIGYFVYSPFDALIGDTRYRVLVNRGWIPKDGKTVEAQSARKIDGQVEIEAVIRAGEDPSSFPENDPRVNQWYSIDVDGMAKWTNSDPILVDMISNSETNKELLARPLAPLARNGRSIALKNDHLAYAVTWFGMCGISAVLIRNIARGGAGVGGRGFGAVGSSRSKWF
ncbi:hypothetical protein HDU77_007631 [Chytriomyces hyalinus]|nr:hypothetical protein HDU77_007631 [Chytriomyces hyalinus]